MVAGAVGGALGFGLGLTPPIALHYLAVLGAGSILFTIFIAPILAVFGLLSGSVLALGISSGAALFSRRPGAGRILGGALLGGLGFALFLGPLAIVDTVRLPDGVFNVMGGGLFGLLIALGITVPAAVAPNRAAALAGGALGGALGILIWRTLGFIPLHVSSVPTPILLVSGGLVGLILASSIVWAGARRPALVKQEQEDKTDG